MLDTLATWLLDPSGLTPHGFCLLWEPWLIWTHALANVGIGAAYFTIPLALMVFARRRRDLAFRPVFWLFATFILLCGTGHWLDLLTLWVPAYGLEGAVKVATALISVATAVALWPLMPKALALPSHAQLRESEARHRELFAQAPIPLYSLDLEGRLLSVSDRWLEFVGYGERDEVLGRHLSEFMTEEGVRIFRERWPRFLAEGGFDDVEFHLVKRSGEVADVLISARLLRDGAGAPARTMGALVDITARKRAKAALRESEARHRANFASAPVPLHVLDPEGRIAEVSDRWLDLFGYAREEVVGRWVGDFQPDGGAATRAALAAVLTAAAEFRDTPRQFVRRDGAVLDVLVSSRVERAPDGAPTRLLTALVDVTERKRAEAALRESEERLHQAQKMEAIGQLTGGIAHDFNNMLTAVMGNLELIRSRVRDERPDVARFADNALDAAGKAAGLTAQLLSFSRRQRLDPKPLDPVEVVEGLRPLLARTVGDRISLEIEAEDDVGQCLADQNQLESAVLNLVINARDAIGPAPGAIAVSLRAEQVKAAPDGWPPDSDYIRIAVRDDGPGMPEEVRRRAFEPFFTTKAPGQGTGLGLAQIHGFAHQSGGTVAIDSAPGQGTEVAILLPRTGAASSRGRDGTRAEADILRGRGETVLLVEDNASVRGSMAATLADLGYRVLEAEDADVGLAVLDRGAAIDLVLTDLTMPGSMDGLDLAEAARGRHPGLPIVLATGHLDTLRERQLPAGAGFLQKPCDRVRLAATLRHALDDVAGTVPA